MASIIITGETMEEVPEVKKMVDDLLKGKISMSRFIKFLDDNNLETKVRCVKENTNPSILADFIGDTLSTIFSIPEKSEHEDTEENDDDERVEDDENEETVENEWENPDELWKKTNEAYEKHVKDTVDFAKRLIDDYGDSEEDDIEHTRAVKLYHSLMVLARTYHQRAFKGDERYNIPNFVPENILKFIESLDLPTDKIKAASERGKAYYYKMKIYKSFEEFEKNMKDAYGIEDVWTPPKEIPDWFEAVRNMQYHKFHNDEPLEAVDEDEWNEFQKWRKERIKEDFKPDFEIDKENPAEYANKLFREIMNLKQNPSLSELVGINDLALTKNIEGLEECVKCLKKSKNASLINIIFKYLNGADRNPILQQPSSPRKNPSKDSSDSAKKVDAKEVFEDQCRCIVDTIIDEFSPILTGKALKHFEKMYKSYNNTFMRQLKSLFSAVKSAKNDGLICFIDTDDSGTIICNPIPNTTKDIEEKLLNAASTKSDSKETSDKKSSTSKKTTTSASVKNDKTTAKKTTAKSSKTDTGAKLKEFKGYADYILLNSSVEDDARDLLLSYAANMDERCKKLYEYLVNLKKKNKAVKLIKYLDDKTGNVDIGFTGIED